MSVDMWSERLSFYVAEKKAGREFQSLKVIGINELGNVFVEFVYNLIVKGCPMFNNHVFSANEVYLGDYRFYLIIIYKLGI